MVLNPFRYVSILYIPHMAGAHVEIYTYAGVHSVHVLFPPFASDARGGNAAHVQLTKFFIQKYPIRLRGFCNTRNRLSHGYQGARTWIWSWLSPFGHYALMADFHIAKLEEFRDRKTIVGVRYANPWCVSDFRYGGYFTMRNVLISAALLYCVALVIFYSVQHPRPEMCAIILKLWITRRYQRWFICRCEVDLMQAIRCNSTFPIPDYTSSASLYTAPRMRGP